MSTILYKSVYGEPTPRIVTAEDPTYPNHDSEGDVIYINTHFKDLAKAWGRHLAEHRAGVSLAAGQVKSLREQLREAESKAATAAIAFRDAEWEHLQWERAR